MTTNPDVGDVIRHVRQGQDYSVQQLALKVNIGRTLLHGIEDGRCMPKEDVLRRMANAFGLPEENVLAWSWRLPEDVMHRACNPANWEAIRALPVAPWHEPGILASECDRNYRRKHSYRSPGLAKVVIENNRRRAAEEVIGTPEAP